jgi:hypothetical protein
MEKQPDLALSDYLALTLIAVFILAIYLPHIFSGTSCLALPLEHDIILQWIPFKEFTASSFQQGFFPLWTHNVFAGMPFLAFSHTGVLYPPGWILLNNYPAAVNWFYPAHLIIAAFGMFFLLRSLRLSAFSSALAALCMVLTGKFFYFIHFLPSACSNPWSPWFFYFMLQLMRQSLLRHGLGLAVVFALQILGGDVESTSYQLIFAVPFLALFFWREGQGMRARRLMPLLAALLLGAALASAQLIPLIEYSANFLRAPGETFEYFSRRTLPLKIFWAMLYPITRIEEMANLMSPKPYFYLGMITILSSVFALIRGSRPSSRPLFLIALLALIYSFGSLEVLDKFIYHIPFLNKYGAPEHAFYLFQIFLTITAAQGLDEISRIKLLKNSPRTAPLIILPGLCLIFLLDIYLPAFRNNDRHTREIYELNPEIPDLVNMAHDPYSRFIAVSHQGIRDQDLVYHIGMRINRDFLDGWITVPPLRYGHFMSRIDKRAATFDENGKLAELGLNVDLRDGLFISEESMPLLDLLSFRYILDRGLNLKFASPYILSQGRRTKSIKVKEEIPAITFPVFVEQSDVLAFRKHLCFQDEKESPVTFQFMLKDEKDLHLLYQGQMMHCDEDDSRETDIIEISLDPWAGKNVEIQFIILSYDDVLADYFWREMAWISNPKRPIQILASNSIDLFENREALPRAFVAHEVELITDPEELLDTLASKDRFSLRRKVFIEKQTPALKILEQSIKERNINPENFPGRVNQVRRAPGLDVYQVWSVIPGMVFTSDQYLPGWRAELDGKEWPILRADYCFRAVFITEGKHILRLIYDPKSFHIGLWTSISTILSILCIIIASKIRNSNKLH